MRLKSLAVSVFACIVLAAGAILSVPAQSDEDRAAIKIISDALSLYQAGRYVEALPNMKVVAEAMPDSMEVQLAYAKCLLGASKQTRNTDEPKQLSQKALEQFRKAKTLGAKGAEIDTLIAMLSGTATAPADGPAYSLNKEAEKMMVEAENFFAQSKCDEAIKSYAKALAIDPKLYQAALGSGDCYTAKSDWSNAEKWYQRAISIDPNRETAYRYSGTPLMSQKKYDLALDRYIEALITEPYNSMSRRGITQWAQVTGAKLGHPKIDIPTLIIDSSGKLVLPADAAAHPWGAYAAVRESWRKEKFTKAFPKETAYRHSLLEEAEALRAALSAADPGASDAQLAILAKINDEGLLEAFILLARADEGIAVDHPEYLKENRAKLHQYVANYVVHTK
jgi:tetratricopeptide (TPR) repeat protein